jgi:hypothetical protein
MDALRWKLKNNSQRKYFLNARGLQVNETVARGGKILPRFDIFSHPTQDDYERAQDKASQVFAPLAVHGLRHFGGYKLPQCVSGLSNLV